MARRLIVEIVGDASSLQAALGKSIGATTGFAGKLQAAGEGMSSVGKKLTRDLTLPLVAVGGASAKAAVDFQNSMELIHTQAGVSQKAVDQFSKSVLQLAGPTATAPETLSQGLFHLASQGLRGAKAMDTLKVAAEGAKMGQANLEDVTNALGAVISSKIGGVHSYEQAMGELNATVGAGDMRMQDLADAMGTGLPAKAAIAGVSLRDVSAALAVFGDNNIRGAAAGTLLNSTLRIMSAPSHAAAKAMGDVGLSATQLADDLRSPGGIVTAVSDLRDHLSGLSKSQQALELTRMFGGKQAGGVQILIDQLDRLKTKVDEVKKGGQNFANDWQAYTQTTAYHLASMGASMQAAGISIGDILLPVVSELTNKISGLVQRFQALPAGVKTAILVFGGIAAAIGPVVSVVGDLSKALVFLAANPIVLVVAGVAALAAAIAAAVIWPDKLRDVLEKMGLSAHAAGEVVSGLQDVFAVVKHAGEQLVAVVRSNWSTIRAIISGAVDIVETAIRGFVTVAEALWRTFGSTILDAARNIWTLIRNSIKASLEEIRGVIDVITGLIHGNWSKVWQGIREIVSGALGQIEALLRGAIGLLGDVAKLIGEAVWEGIVQPIARLAGELLQKIEHGITTAIHTVVGWVVSLAETVGKAIADGIVHGVGGLAGGLLDKLKGGLGGALHGAMHFLGISSPSAVFRDKVGKPIADGIVAGYLMGANALPGKITGSVRVALEQAKSTIESYRSQLTTAWSGLASDAKTALSGLNPGPAKPTGLTAAGSLLAGLTSNHDANAFAASMAQAQQALAAALQTANATTGTAAQLKALADATTKQTLAQNALSQAQTKSTLAQQAMNAAIDKYGANSKQATQASLAYQAAQDAVTKANLALSSAQANVTTAQNALPNQSDAVAAAFTRMQAAQQALTAATQQYGLTSTQAVAAQKALQDATAAAQQVVAAQPASDQQANNQAVIDAQSQLNELLYQQQQQALQARDQLEQQHRAAAYAAAKKRHAAQLAIEKQSLDASLKALEVHLAKEGATQKQAQDAIVKLLKHYGISYKAAGVSLGEAFANGIESTIAKAAAAAEKLAKEVSKYLPHSPAEKGPLSQLPGWADYLLPGLAAAAGAVGSTMTGLAAPGSSRLVPGASGGGGSAQVNVTVHGWVGNDQELAYRLRNELVALGRREPNIFAGFA